MSAVEVRPAYLMGRCANGAERDKGRRVHALPDHSITALCGLSYGRLSAGWAEDPGAAITCPKCQRKVAGAKGEPA